MDIRNWLSEREIAAVIPRSNDETEANDYDRDLYRERPVIEQTSIRLKRFRRVVTRVEKLATTYVAMILEWLRVCRQALMRNMTVSRLTR